MLPFIAKARKSDAMHTIKEQLKNGEFSRLHLLYGEERYMVRYYKNALKKALVAENDDMNFSGFSGEDINWEEVSTLGETLPFFADKRLILIEDSGLFKKSNEVSAMLSEFPDTTYVIFVEKDIDKRNGLYKFMTKNGCVTNSELAPERELVNWVMRYAGNSNKQMSKDVAQYLIGKTGNHMQSLSLELEKLISYAMNKEQITKEDIDLLCATQITDVIFNMIEAVANRNQLKAMEYYHDLLLLKESPRKIISLFVRQFSILLQLKELISKQYSSEQMSKKVGVNSYFIGKYIAQSKKFVYKELKQMVNECAQIVEDANFGRIDDQIAVEMFIIRYSKAV